MIDRNPDAAFDRWSDACIEQLLSAENQMVAIILEWCGENVDGQPCILDLDGTVFIVTHQGGSFPPLLNLTEARCLVSDQHGDD